MAALLKKVVVVFSPNNKLAEFEGYLDQLESFMRQLTGLYPFLVSGDGRTLLSVGRIIP